LPLQASKGEPKGEKRAQPAVSPAQAEVAQLVQADAEDLAATPQSGPPPGLAGVVSTLGFFVEVVACLVGLVRTAEGQEPALPTAPRTGA